MSLPFPSHPAGCSWPCPGRVGMLIFRCFVERVGGLGSIVVEYGSVCIYIEAGV